METLKLYQKTKPQKELEEIRFSSGHRPGSSQGGPIPFTGWLVRETAEVAIWANETEEFYCRLEQTLSLPRAVTARLSPSPAWPQWGGVGPLWLLPVSHTGGTWPRGAANIGGQSRGREGIWVFRISERLGKPLPKPVLPVKFRGGANELSYFFLTSLLEYNCFTMVC